MWLTYEHVGHSQKEELYQILSHWKSISCHLFLVAQAQWLHPSNSFASHLWTRYEHAFSKSSFDACPFNLKHSLIFCKDPSTPPPAEIIQCFTAVLMFPASFSICRQDCAFYIFCLPTGRAYLFFASIYSMS